MKDGEIKEALAFVFTSPNVADRNADPANVVDVLDGVRGAVRRLSLAILPDAAPGFDAADGEVRSLTEAVMGVTGGLCRIAVAIESLADAVRESKA